LKTQTDAGASSSTLSTAAPSPSSSNEEGKTTLISAVARSRLIGRVLGCCDAVLCDLSHEEALLWDSFVAADTDLKGSLNVQGKGLRNLLEHLSNSNDTDRIDTWVSTIGEWSDDDNEVDFADLLDWFNWQREKGTFWNFQTSMRNSLSSLFSSDTQPSRMRPELLTSLRNRLAAMPASSLMAVAASFQRTVVLTSWCLCERRLLLLVTPSPTAGGPPRGNVAALLGVLRGINAELAPTERVLWELIGAKDNGFDGALDKNEVQEAIGELLVYSIEKELGTPMEDFEELQRLRADCRRRSVDALFEDQNRRRKSPYVTLADIIRWWWDMSEDYRVAAGLTVPASLLRRSLHRKPEEMFRDKLLKVAADSAIAQASLQGHIRVLAELRALAVSRALENLQGRTSLSDTWTSATSEVTSETKSCKSKESSDEYESNLSKIEGS